METPRSFSFDPAKDGRNRRDHGVSLQRAEAFAFETAVVAVDDRFDYGELREVATGFIGASLYVVVFIMRDDDTCHAISLRKATPKEARAYAKATTR